MLTILTHIAAIVAGYLLHCFVQSRKTGRPLFDVLRGKPGEERKQANRGKPGEE